MQPDDPGVQVPVHPVRGVDPAGPQVQEGDPGEPGQEPDDDRPGHHLELLGRVRHLGDDRFFLGLGPGRGPEFDLQVVGPLLASLIRFSISVAPAASRSSSAIPRASVQGFGVELLDLGVDRGRLALDAGRLGLQVGDPVA